MLWVIVLLVAAGVGFGVGALTFKPPNPELEGSAVGTSPSQTPSDTGSPGVRGKVVPDLVGLKRRAAEAMLDEDLPNMLYIVAGLGGSSDVVATQNPEAGSPLKDVTRIAIGVHCKPKPCAAPPPGRVIYDPCSCNFR